MRNQLHDLCNSCRTFGVQRSPRLASRLKAPLGVDPACQCLDRRRPRFGTWSCAPRKLCVGRLLLRRRGGARCSIETRRCRADIARRRSCRFHELRMAADLARFFRRERPVFEAFEILRARCGRGCCPYHSFPGGARLGATASSRQADRPKEIFCMAHWLPCAVAGGLGNPCPHCPHGSLPP